MCDGITCSDGGLMDKTIKGFFIAACSVVIGWGLVCATKSTITALAARQAALELAEQNRQTDLKERNDVYGNQLVNCLFLDSKKQQVECTQEVRTKFPEFYK